ncbi:MAG: hypothetical protein WA140_08715 [Geobacteraceae bacterium]
MEEEAIKAIEALGYLPGYDKREISYFEKNKERMGYADLVCLFGSGVKLGGKCRRKIRALPGSIWKLS